MNGEVFAGLILAAVNEVAGHQSEYFSSYAVQARPLDELGRLYKSHPTFAPYPQDRLTKALADGMEALQTRDILVLRGCKQQDAISGLLLDSIMDAFLASTGEISLKPLPINPLPLPELLHDRLALKVTPGGIEYALTGGQGAPLLIISTTGVSINIWSNLLSDRALDRRCLLVQSQSSPLLDGGTRNRATLWDDVAAIEAVLTSEAMTDVDILAWCDGARVAIELARRISGRVASLTLLSPTFHGAVDSKLYPSPFEDNLVEVSKLLGKDPANDHFLLEAIARSATGELARNSGDPRRRQNAVLRLPPRTYAQELLLPLSTAVYLQNYVYRLASDETYDVRSALAATRCPILLLTGTEDAVVNTSAARDVLKENGRDVVHVTIQGAGHHIHVLQYHYFRYVFDSFMRQAVPRDTARLKVEKLSG